jgi:hypothetical protein
MPGKVKNLGDIDLYFYLNDVFQGKKRLYYSGGMDLVISGEKYTLDYLDGYDYPTFWEIFINGDYEKEPLCVVEEGDVVLDIGANKGFFTLNSLQKGASKVYSVEPVKNSYEQIKKLLNDFPNVNPINKAIGETNGTISMFIDLFELLSTLISFKNAEKHISSIFPAGILYNLSESFIDIQSPQSEINLNFLLLHHQLNHKVN